MDALGNDGPPIIVQAPGQAQKRTYRRTGKYSKDEKLKRAEKHREKVCGPVVEKCKEEMDILKSMNDRLITKLTAAKRIMNALRRKPIPERSTIQAEIDREEAARRQELETARLEAERARIIEHRRLAVERRIAARQNNPRYQRVRRVIELTEEERVARKAAQKEAAAARRLAKRAAAVAEKRAYIAQLEARSDAYIAEKQAAAEARLVAQARAAHEGNRRRLLAAGKNVRRRRGQLT